MTARRRRRRQPNQRTRAQKNAGRATALASIAAYGFCFFCFGMQVNMLGPSVDALAARAAVRVDDLGYVSTLTGFISIVGAVPSGWMVDRLPGHLVLAAMSVLEVRGVLCVLCALCAVRCVVLCCCALCSTLLYAALRAVRAVCAQPLCRAQNSHPRARPPKNTRRASSSLKAAGFFAVPWCGSLGALMAAYGLVGLTWNVLNTGGNALCCRIARQYDVSV